MISRDDWLTALTDAGLHHENDELALTALEFAAMFGLTRSTAESQLSVLVAHGKATRTRKRLVNGYGRTVSYVAYRLADRSLPHERPRSAKRSAKT